MFSDATRNRIPSALAVVEGVALATLVADTSAFGIVRSAAALAATAAVVRAARPPTRRRSDLASLAFAVTGLIAGVAIGIQHVIVDPISPKSVAGVTAIVAGLAFTTVAATRLVRSMRGWRRLWAVPIGLVTLVAIVLPAMLSVYVTNPPDFPLGEATPADHGMEYEDVTVTTDDGVDLEAWYVPSKNGASIVLLGGCCSARDSMLDLASLIAGNDYGVLMLDTRGHGGSEGKAMLWGWWGELDVSAGVDYLATRPDVLDGRIGAIGMSVGGEQAFAAAGVDERIIAVVGEGATARGARDEGNSAEGVGGLLVRYVDGFTKTAASAMTAAPRPTPMREAFAAMADQRALVIAAGTSPEEISAAESFEAAAPDVVSTWIVPGAKHTGARLADPTEFEDRVFTFFDDALDVSRSTARRGTG